MDSRTGPVVVMGSGRLAEGSVKDGRSPMPAPGSLIAGGPFLAYVVRGEGCMRVGGVPGALRPGTLVSATAGPIEWTMSDNHEVLLMAVRVPDHEGGLAGFTPPLVRQLSRDDGETWRERLTRMPALAEVGRLRDEDIRTVKRDLGLLLWLKRAPHAHEALETIYHWLWERSGEPLSLATIAEQAGYTPNYLNDLTREHTGRSLGKWVAEIRMTRARYELETSTRPIAEIGAACGYDDPSYFSRAFLRWHGLSPGLWRLAKSDEARDGRLSVPLAELNDYAARITPERSYRFAS